LAVGTEVTDGQIIDRNSAWISQKIVAAGCQVLEHRAVPDDRVQILRALRELLARVDLLFVTGGLGPTSDDFTRELIAEVAGQPLDFDDGSWAHIVQVLSARGIAAREIQKQQCYFPRGARVLENPAGTANAFELSIGSEINGRTSATRLIALPGPPAEIAAVWERHLAKELEALTPESQRETLHLVRCLGLGESQIAEIVEKEIEDAVKSGLLRVGYRAHLPYIEVKLWYLNRNGSVAKSALARVESALAQWIVNRGDEDALDGILAFCRAGQRLFVLDQSTSGLLQERLTSRLRESPAALPIGICVESQFGKFSATRMAPQGEFFACVESNPNGQSWRLSLLWPDGREKATEEKPLFNYPLHSERARRYITEKFFLTLANWLNQT
jgi:molybdenum cofactor synthesis domain-containing protein